MKKPFEKQVYIRLIKNDSGLICTVKYGALAWKATEFSIGDAPDVNGAVVKEPEPELVLRKLNRP